MQPSPAGATEGIQKIKDRVQRMQKRAQARASRQVHLLQREPGALHQSTTTLLALSSS
jgi:hypothetical protein